MSDDMSLLDRVQAVYDRLWRNDNNRISQYSRDAMSDETLFALVYSCVTGDATNLVRERDLSYDTVTYDEVLEYANETYGYEVCLRCDSDMCEHL